MKMAKHINKRLTNSDEGFSLIEVIVALAVLTIGILSVNAMQIVSVRGNNTANGITTATNWAADRIEQICNADYDDLKDTDGDGTGQDPNKDGADDNGGNFGLDDNTPTVAGDNSTADNTWTSPDGNYTILWNVADDYPMPNIKTVSIIVNRNDRGVQKSTRLLYRKAKYM